MDRSPSREEKGLKKGPWTPEEDEKLIQHIQKHGLGSWRALPKLAGLNRCGKSCRLRWTNYLRPDIKRGKFSQEEEQIILHLHSILGNKWSAIATHLPGRTDNEIKNFWNTHLKKKLIQMGFDPMTHQPRTDLFSSLPHLMALAYNLKDHDLLNHHPLMDLQLLHTLLLQSTASSSYNSPQNGNDVVGDDHYVEPLINLLNSVDTPPMKENQVSNLFSHDPHEYFYNDSSGGTITTSPQPLHQYPALSSHPDPQKVSFSFQPSLNSDHHQEHEEIMGQRLSNPDHTIIISPHDHHINHDHDSATWFLPPLYTSNIHPNLIDHEDLMSNNVIIPRDSTSTTASSYGGPSCTTTSNSHWPADQLFS